MSEIHIKEEISNWKDQFRAELFENVLPFWLKYSIDQEKGGFFACLDNDGEIYDRRKFMWLNGRQIWMFARLAMRYSEKDFVELSNGKLSLESRAVMLESAYRAAVFMFTNGVREDGMVYFSLAEDGRPYHFERKIFSACFLCLGMATLGMVLRSEASTLREKGDDLVQKALHMLHNIISWSHDPSPLNRPSCPGAPATSPMNVPMILLNLLDEFRLCGALSAEFCAEINKLVDYNQEERWCIEEIVKHVRKSEKIVLEVVGKDGSVIPGYDGRHMNPGHAIEAGWFVFNYAKRTNNQELIDLAVNMVDWSFERGWDEKHQGLFYFLDSEGRSPPYLEWNMKLWWPHCETLVAYAMLYQHSHSEEDWKRFVKTAEYTFQHFSDAKNGGEWFGYLDQEGRVTHRFKGGPYKGCFHVPRSLFFVYEILASINN